MSTFFKILKYYLIKSLVTNSYSQLFKILNSMFTFKRVINPNLKTYCDEQFKQSKMVPRGKFAAIYLSWDLSMPIKATFTSDKQFITSSSLAITRNVLWNQSKLVAILNNCYFHASHKYTSTLHMCTPGWVDEHPQLITWRKCSHRFIISSHMYWNVLKNPTLEQLYYLCLDISL